MIERRFRGPPESGNGGYSCGVLAEGVSGVATVTLRLPPPLDRPLTLGGDGEQSRLSDGENIVGEATRSTLDLEVPEAPGLEVAVEAARHYAGFESHPFPGCFVCGPERAPGDGLRIFPGAAGAGRVGPPAGVLERRGDLDGAVVSDVGGRDTLDAVRVVVLAAHQMPDLMGGHVR